MPTHYRLSWTTLLVVLIAIWLGYAPAAAQMPGGVVGLICDPSSNRALVSFGYHDEDGTVHFASSAPELYQDLYRRPAASANSCHLANGWEVKVKHGVQRVFPLGRCGAAPPEFFSLWVDQRKVLSRETFLRECFEARLHGVLIRPTGLTICSFTEQQNVAIYGMGGTVGCDELPTTALTGQRDELEYPPPGANPPTPGKMLLPFAADQVLCRSFIAAGFHEGDPEMAGRTIVEQGVLPEQQDETISFHSIKDPQPKFEMRVNRQYPSVRRTTFDFDNDRKEDVVYRVEGWSGADWGNYFIFASIEGRSLAALDAEVEKTRFDMHNRKNVPSGWHIFDGGTQFSDVVRVNRTTYVLTYSYYAEPPSAELLRPQLLREPELVCKFQRVDDNF